MQEMTGITPIHIDDTVSSLSAILLNEDYYKVLLAGKIVAKGLSVLRPEYLILFKAKAYIDLKKRKENGETVSQSDIKKHKNDVLRIAAELKLERDIIFPESVKSEIGVFIEKLENEPFDDNLLKEYGLKNQEVIELLRSIY